MKHDDGNRKRRRLKTWIISLGVVFTLVTLAAMIVNICLLVLVINKSTPSSPGNGSISFIQTDCFFLESDLLYKIKSFIYHTTCSRCHLYKRF
jgi:hypothetical protein